MAVKFILRTENTVERFLGISTQRKEEISIKIALLIDSITPLFCMSEEKATTTPIETVTKIDKDEAGNTTDTPY